MKIICSALLMSGVIISPAFCTKAPLDDGLFNILKKTAHKPSPETLVFDEETVREEAVDLQKGAHKPTYTEKVTAIDHKGETLTLRSPHQQRNQ